MKHRVLVPVAVLLVVLPLRSLGGDMEGPRADRADARDWAGVWRLDRDASDPIEPLLELMEAPWLARKIANAMTPRLTITLLPDGALRILNENPIKTTDREMRADGVRRARTDALGREVVSEEAWTEDGELVVTETTHVGDDRVVVVTSTWRRVENGLEFTARSETDSGPLVIRRVFRREP